MPLGGRGPGLHLLAPSEDGHVYVVEGATACVKKIDVGERLAGMVVADDLSGDGNLELVVATMGGEVGCIAQEAPNPPPSHEHDVLCGGRWSNHIVRVTCTFGVLVRKLCVSQTRTMLGRNSP